MTAADLRSDETKYNDARVDRAVAAERERCAKIADERQMADRQRYVNELDWQMPYGFNRVVRASMGIAAAIRNEE